MTTPPRGQYLKMATLTTQKQEMYFKENVVKTVQDSDNKKNADQLNVTPTYNLSTLMVEAGRS